jgi:peptidoglycan/LPS O-acetylase OafA/YrhL
VSILNVQNVVNVTPEEPVIAANASLPKAVAGHSRLPYLPGIDGLRAIAVLAVLFYHAEVPWMPGGFLGVEVFFVISGYLITGLLLAEWRKNAKINLGQFWFRRARRLLPAVFLLLLAVLLYAVLFLPNEVASLRFDVLAATAYVSNWYQVFSHKSYFEAIGRPPLLRHLWSLAVEEQFYLVWPLLLAAALRWLHPRKQIVFPFLVLGLAVASTALMMAMYQPDLDPSRIYYGTDTRAAGFLIGAALAMFVALKRDATLKSRCASVLLDASGSVALLSLFVCFVKLDEINPYLYLGGFTFVSLLTAVIIVSVGLSGTRLVPRILGNRVFTWIGLRSYSIYLWHWPIFDLTRPHLDIALDGIPLLILRFALTLVCAELSYRFVERPIHDGALSKLWNRVRTANSWRHMAPWVAGAGTSVVLAIALGISVVNAKPADFPSEYADTQPIATVEAVIQGAPSATPTAVVGSTATKDRKPTPTLVSMSTPTPIIARATYQPQWPYSLLTSTVDISDTADTARITPMPAKATVIRVETATVADAPSVAPATPTPVAPTSTPIPSLITQTVTDVLGANYHVLAIGDSVMLGASLDLQQATGGAEVDAVVSRQAVAAIALLQQRRDARTLGDIVVLHIGSNGYVTPKQFDEMMQILSGVRLVAVVNVRVPRRWQGPNNTLFDEGVKRTPNAVLVDWYSVSDPHRELFVEDGVHLQLPGRRLYAQTIVAQIKTFDAILKQRQGSGKTTYQKSEVIA